MLLEEKRAKVNSFHITSVLIIADARLILQSTGHRKSYHSRAEAVSIKGLLYERYGIVVTSSAMKHIAASTQSHRYLAYHAY